MKIDITKKEVQTLISMLSQVPLQVTLDTEGVLAELRILRDKLKEVNK